MKTRSASLFVPLILALSACATGPAGNRVMEAAAAPAISVGAMSKVPVDAARVALSPASGSLVSGRIEVRPMGDGVHFTGDIGGLAPNSVHGMHVHDKGDCSAADASSAGGHFNPTAQPHGRAGSGAHHTGDLPNITADSAGVAHVDVHLDGASLGGGRSGDIFGRALVVHAQADDYASQPAGNSGARIACGVIRDAR